jgi:magnesium chelatase family protein
MDARVTESRLGFDEDAREELRTAYTYGRLSARGRHRIMRVARTVADLARRDLVTRDDLLVAVGLRQRLGSELVEVS